MGNVAISWNWRMKGNMKECANWRGITLLLKLNSFSRVLSEKMKEEVETITILRDEQVGFRPERRCTDQIATLLMILEQSRERNMSLCVVFISVRLWTGSWRKQQTIKQEESNGLCLNTLLEDIHFAEDVPLFQKHNNMTQNSESMRETAAMTGLEINIQKMKSLWVNQENNAAVTLEETKYCAIRILNTKRVDFVKAVFSIFANLCFLPLRENLSHKFPWKRSSD